MAKHTTCDVCGVGCSHDFYHIQVRSSDQTTVNVNKHLCRVCSELMVDVLEHPSECMMPKRLAMHNPASGLLEYVRSGQAAKDASKVEELTKHIKGVNAERKRVNDLRRSKDA